MIKAKEFDKAFLERWIPPIINDDIPQGDMPKSHIKLYESHVKKANTIFPNLIDFLTKSHKERMIISLSGGSGVGKTGTAAVLAYYLNTLGIVTYIMSGDNYPYRIPKANDAHRHEIYDDKGKQGLKQYLGSNLEVNYDEINIIFSSFIKGDKNLTLKRMGRELNEIWYETVDVSQTQILLLEWTHGNNILLNGVDLRIYLDSNPADTLQNRKNRNRDTMIESPFTTMVLELEQELLHSQMEIADMIVSRDGGIACK